MKKTYKKTYKKEIIKLLKDLKVLSKATMFAYFNKGENTARNRKLERDIAELIEAKKILKIRLAGKKHKTIKKNRLNKKVYYSLSPVLYHKEHSALVELVASLKLLQGHKLVVETAFREFGSNVRSDITVFENGETIYYEIENEDKTQRAWKTKFDEYARFGLLEQLKVVCSSERMMEKLQEFMAEFYKDNSLKGISLVSQYDNVVESKLGKYVKKVIIKN